MKTILAAALLAASMPAVAEEFTIDRLVAGPSINGSSMRGLQMSPDGKRITFLRGKESNRNQLDLWEFDTKSGKAKLLIDSNVLLGGKKEELSEEEKARRERQRIGGISGITRYFWSKDSKSLMFPVGGDVYVLPLGGKVKRLTDTPEFETDIRFSPKSTYVSFVRNREVYIVNVKTGEETKLTSGSTDTIANGMAEFVAQEELGRFTGYWWSPDETKVAFEQFDESDVIIKDRYEVKGDGSVTSIKQRYPEAGTTNVTYKLGVVSVADKSVDWIDAGGDQDTYLGRVNWTPDSQTVIYQRLNRPQTQLDMVLAAADGSSQRTLLTEQSDIWVNLHNILRFTNDGNNMLWASERTGFRHLYNVNMETGEATPITSGDWVVSSVNRVDEENGTIYFSGFKDSPIESHLYSVPMAGGDITRITKEEGWHGARVGDGFFIDNFSSPTQPPQIVVKDLKDGAVRFAINENKLDDSHPYGKYIDGAAKQSFGTIKASDGSDLYYRLYLPPSMEEGKKYPAIMAPYGGPHGQSVRKTWSVNFNEILARKGFVVMVLDNRGMWNRGIEFEGHIKNAMGTVEVEDQVTGANYLKTLDFIDGDKIGMWGWSYGGYMTIINMFKAPDVFKAGVSVAPVTDWRLYDTAYTERYLSHPNDPGNVYENSSVFKYADNFKGDLLLIHGMADDNVFFDNAVKLMATLQKEGKPFELMTYPGKKHGIRGENTRKHLWKLALDFFERKLK
ncbi:S9 family peptidase [Kordiimonas laminariae]|uniref:S9 family peptidase n=1 Tax=Kordiimonas laminariae TaxID=2917717 RepID=UPI001FF3B676|nr:S9 family peptidase [Kordiimonas laminariae]MCK0069779.1 S9 family peptidase [Kordiimonas laminariae]